MDNGIIYLYGETGLIKLSKTSHNNSSNKIPRYILKIEYYSYHDY